MGLGLSNIFAAGGNPDGFNCGALSVDDGHLDDVQLDGLQNVSNCPTGDTLNTFVGSDGDTQVHRAPGPFTLSCNNKHGNIARFTSVATTVPAILAGRHYINPNPITYSFGDLVEADGVTPVPGTTTLALAKTAFGGLIDDWLTGKMYSISDLTARPLSGGSGWAFLSTIKTEQGFVSWHPINRNEMSDILNTDFRRSTGPIDFLPFNRGIIDQWTSTESLVGFGYILDASNAIITDFFAFTTTALQSIYVRDNRNDP